MDPTRLKDRLLIVHAFRQLTPKQEKVLRLLYGIGCERAHEPWEIAEEFDVTIGLIKQISTVGARVLQAKSGLTLHHLRAIGRWEQGGRSHKPLIEFKNCTEQADIRTGAQRLFDELNITQQMLLQLTPRQFEEVVAEIWVRLGYTVELTKQTRDGGADIIAIKRSEAEVRFLVECKRYSPEHKVGVEIIRALYGVKAHDGATKGFLATTSSFTSGAMDFCADHKWELEARDFKGITDWIYRAKGYKRTDTGLYIP